MTDTDDEQEDDSSAEEEYDPSEFVPDRIDQVTASGLEQLHDALGSERKAKFRSVAIETQAAILWDLVEKGAISLDVTRPNGEADR
jgi:hypothetical protein